ncbi:MAG: hypothetical protein AMXMBFR36_18470 [Acidobacteriota bacterium]
MSSRTAIDAAIVVALALIAAGAVVAAEAAATPRGERIGVEIDVQRAGEGTYACRTTVRDLPTKLALAEPQVEAREGSTAFAFGSGAGFDVEVQILVGAGGERIDHVVLVRQAGAVVSSQSVTLRLDR